MAVRLLNPQTPVLARAESAAIARNMASFGTDHIVNPFERFGAHLALALAAPASQRLIDWLTTPPDATFVPSKPPPRGHWVVAGYGRFGREVTDALRAQGLDTRDVCGLSQRTDIIKIEHTWCLGCTQANDVFELWQGAGLQRTGLGA